MTGDRAGLPGPRLAADDSAELPRLAAYRAAHPGVIIGDLGFGTVWQARIPHANGETVVSRYTLRELLDKLSGLDGGAPDPPDSG